MQIFHIDQFVLPLPAGHRFPMEKYAMLRHAVAAFAGELLCVPDAAHADELVLAHDPDYITQVFSGKLPAAAQREIGFPWSPGLVERSRRSVGATIAACRSALWSGCGVNLAGGTHHAAYARGSGFCVFNDIVTAVRVMQREGRIRRALVVDLDVHQGNGTAALCEGDASMYTFSMHGAGNFPFRKHPGDWDIEFPDGTGDEPYLAALASALPALFTRARPDLLVYLAGADPLASDRLGKLNLSQAGLAARDAMVLDACDAQGMPVALCMGGGYAQPISDTVAVPTETVRETVRRYAGAR